MPQAASKMGDVPRPRKRSTASPSTEVLDVAVARIGTGLAGSFAALLEHLPGAPHRPQELARKLGINKDLSSRILRATETKDPIAVAHFIPGPEPLRRLIRAAARKNVDSDIVLAAEESVREFERLIRSVAGDRAGLDTIISAWLPEVREKAELLSKQAVFKGMSQIRGSCEETSLAARFLHPAAAGNGWDFVTLSASIGVRRLRSGAIISNDEIAISKSPPAIFTIDGTAVNGHNDVMLPAFCSTPAPHFDIRHERGVMFLTLAGDEVGLQSTVDLAWAHLRKDCKPRGVFATINTPIKKLVMDLFFHSAIRPAADPLLEIYDTTIRGVARFRDPERTLDRLDIKATIDYLGQGVSKFRCSDVPRYIEMIGHVCERMKWDPTHFHGYRCAIEYPVYGSQICMAIDPTPDTTNPKVRIDAE